VLITNPEPNRLIAYGSLRRTRQSEAWCWRYSGMTRCLEVQGNAFGIVLDMGFISLLPHC